MTGSICERSCYLWWLFINLFVGAQILMEHSSLLFISLVKFEYLNWWRTYETAFHNLLLCVLCLMFMVCISPLESWLEPQSLTDVNELSISEPGIGQMLQHFPLMGWQWKNAHFWVTRLAVKNVTRILHFHVRWLLRILSIFITLN